MRECGRGGKFVFILSGKIQPYARRQSNSPGLGCREGAGANHSVAFDYSMKSLEDGTKPGMETTRNDTRWGLASGLLHACDISYQLSEDPL